MRETTTILPLGDHHHARDDSHLKRVIALRPEVALALGLVQQATGLPGGAATERAAFRSALSDWRADMEGQSEESADRLLDVRVFVMSHELLGFCEDDLAWHRTDVDVVSGLLATLLLQMRGQHPSEVSRFEALSTQLLGLDAALASARTVVEGGHAHGLRRATDVLDAAPDFVRAIEDAAQRARQSDAIPQALQQKLAGAAASARQALEQHRAWLLSVPVRPFAPMGAEAFDELLRLRGLDLRGTELLSLARTVAEEVRAEEARVRRRAYREKTPQEAVVAARRAVPLSVGEALSWTNELVRELDLFVRNANAVAVLPAGSERVVTDVMPSFLAVDGSNAVLIPPQMAASVHESLLLLRETVPGGPAALEDLSVADLENIATGLTYPGAHLQQVWHARKNAVARRGVPLGSFSPLASTWGLDASRGWTLYCEEMLREQQFRHSPASRLLMLRRALTSVLGAIADVALATGRLSPDAAVDFLVRRAALRPAVAQAQMRAMLRVPGAALSGFVGKIRIDQLRREARKRWRHGYSERRFTSFLLAAGPVPLAYLFDRLEEPEVTLS